jgi:hypothetical protein
MIVRERTSQAPDRERRGKHERDRVEIREPQMPLIVARARGEEQQRTGHTAEQTAERADVLPDTEDQPRVVAQLLGKVQEDGEEMRADNAANQHPPAEALTNDRVEITALELLPDGREREPHGHCHCDPKGVNGQRSNPPHRLLEVWKHQFTPG